MIGHRLLALDLLVWMATHALHANNYRIFLSQPRTFVLCLMHGQNSSSPMRRSRGWDGCRAGRLSSRRPPPGADRISGIPNLFFQPTLQSAAHSNLAAAIAATPRSADHARPSAI